MEERNFLNKLGAGSTQGIELVTAVQNIQAKYMGKGREQQMSLPVLARMLSDWQCHMLAEIQMRRAFLDDWNHSERPQF